LASCSVARGQLTEARDRIERSLTLSREIGMGFCGLLALAIKSRLLDDEGERERCRAEAETLLAQRVTSHNVFNHYRHGIEDALVRGEWARALEHATALETYTRPEPLPFSDFLIARARTLVGLVSHPEDRTLHEELSRLRAEAERARWPIDWTTAAAIPR
jgi:ATP/maltotriose-dependent transcriptional regulator MalT